MKPNSLNSFNEGGSHSQNPLGGIPMGMGQNGQMNTVEEGETKKGNFVYSDRLKLNKEMVKLLNLPKGYEGKSMAEASKFVDSKFKDRTDKISMSTKNGMLDKIAQIQESEKARQQAEIQAALQVNSTEVPDMMQGEVPEGMDQNQMFLGGMVGGIGSMTDVASTANTAGSMMNTGSGMGGSALGAVGQMGQGLPNNMNTSNTPMSAKELQTANTWEGAKDAAGNIPIIGMFAKAGRGVEKFGKGIGQAFGGDKGGDFAKGFLDPMSNVLSKDTSFGEKALSVMDPVVSGIIMANKNKEKRDEANYQNNVAMQSKFSNDFALGGNLGNPPQEGTINDDWMTQNLVYQYNNQPFPNGEFRYTPPIQPTTNISQDQLDNPGFNVEQPYSSNKLGKANLKPAVDWAKNNYGNMMRYAPVAMNALQLSQLKKPEQERLNRLDSRFKPEYVDERSLQNIVGNEYDSTINGLTNASNGSLGTLRGNILGAGYNKTRAMSEAYVNAANQNRQMNMQGQQFNLGIDQANIGQDNLERDINARNRAAYDNNKSKLQTGLAENIGAIGKEEVYKKMAKEMFGYGWDGQYYIDKNGLKRTPAQVQKEVDDAQKNSITATNENKLGGYLLNNKKK